MAKNQPDLSSATPQENKDGTSTTASESASTSAPPSPSLALAGKLGDQMKELGNMFYAYVALERFVAPVYTDETHAAVQPTRTELGAMLRMFNNEIWRQLGACMDTAAELQAHMLANERPAS